MKHTDMQSAFSGKQQNWLRMQGTFGDKIENVQEINFNDGKTKVVVNAKLSLDINKDKAKLDSQIEDKKNKFELFKKRQYKKINRKEKIK